jgi:hypothetical protein
MTLGALIQRCTWPEVQSELTGLGANASQFDAYQLIFRYLLVAEPEPDDMTIVIEPEDVSDESIPVVLGRRRTLNSNEDDEETYDLSFVRWENWLSMVIDERRLASTPNARIVAYCLDEMTTVSFSPDDIQENIEEIRGLVDAIRQEGAAPTQDGPGQAPADG